MRLFSSERPIAIVGLGYIGLPLPVEFGSAHQMFGFDINRSRVAELQSGHDRTLEIQPSIWPRLSL